MTLTASPHVTVRSKALSEKRFVDKILINTLVSQIDQEVYRLAFEKAQKQWGELREDDIFIPPGFDLTAIFDWFYKFNDDVDRIAPIIKLYEERDLEHWRFDKTIRFRATRAGVLRLCGSACSFGETYENQLKEIEADRLISIEMLTWAYGYNFVKGSYDKMSRHPIRCDNQCGRNKSIYLNPNRQDNGLYIGYCEKEFKHPTLGTIIYDFVPLS